jgi:hypothetical protein
MTLMNNLTKRKGTCLVAHNGPAGLGLAEMFLKCLLLF